MVRLNSILGLLVTLFAASAVGQTNTFPLNGNVGIGTTTPIAQLNVQADAPELDTSWTAAQILINGAADSNKRLSIGYDTSNNIGVIQAGDAGVSYEPLLLNPGGGTVGIGMSNPLYNLDVAGMIHSSAGIVFPDGTTQTTALKATQGTTIIGDPTYGDINLTLTGANVPVINFTRWTGEGSVQNNASAGLFFNPSDQEYDFGIGTGVSPTGSQTATNTIITVTQSGNVGIGTTNPGGDLASLASPPSAGTSILEVKGDIALAQGSGGQVIYQDGTVQSTAWNGTTLGGDYAESIDVLGDRAAYAPGDVIVIDDSVTGKFNKSAEAYSKLVAGVYSTKPGLVGRRLTTDRPDKAAEVPMAMMGIVPTKVNTENGPIARGDLLVSSGTPGYAMKGTDRDRMLGAVIGKAMGNLHSGAGVIEVLVTLQ